MESRTLMANISSLTRIVALVTLASGLANLYSVMSPLSPARLRSLNEILPPEFLRFPRSFILLIFGFGGLKAYKAKFASSWEPRYVIYRHALDLPKVGIALGKVSKLK